MNIYLLEDDKVQRKHFLSIVQRIVTERQLTVADIFDTGSPDALLAHVQTVGARGTQVLYFLDIEIKDVSHQSREMKKGLEVARQIRQRDRFASIVFVTTHTEFAPITYAYQVAALQFIDKEQDENQLVAQVRQCIDYATLAGQSTAPADVFQFDTEYSRVQLPFAELLYFETLVQPHKVAIVTTNQRIEFYSNLTLIEEMDPRLIRCHRSFVVNVTNIVAIDRTSGILSLRGGASCYLSRRRFKAVNDCLAKFG